MVKLRSLQAFCAAVEEKTISGAARRMYLSQPSVSEKVAELEREARVKLLERSRQGVSPTAEGELVYKHGKKALDEITVLEQVLRDFSGKREAMLRFAASSTLGEHLLPEWLRNFRRERPETILELFVGNTREVVDLVKEAKVAFGVIEGEESHPPLECLPLLDDELVVVVAPDHPWAKRRICVEDLSGEPFVSREKGSGTREIVEHSLESTGISLNIQTEIGSTSGIKEAVEAGLGFSIVSRAALRLELRTGTLTVAEGFAIPRRFTLVRHPSATMNRIEESFYGYLMRVREAEGSV